MHALIGREECLHESQSHANTPLTQSLWRQDVSLFALLSCKHEFEKVLGFKT